MLLFTAHKISSKIYCLQEIFDNLSYENCEAVTRNSRFSAAKAAVEHRMQVCLSLLKNRLVYDVDLRVSFELAVNIIEQLYYNYNFGRY